MGPSAPAPAPKAPDPIRIPSADDADLKAASKLKTQEEFAKRNGRASTQLAGYGTGDTAYSRTTLG